MIALALGLAAAGLAWAVNAFSRASVADVRAFFLWVAALAGVILAVLLLLTGRGMVALSLLVLAGPLAWSFWAERRVPPTSRPAAMTRQDALDVLGLSEGASDSDVRAAYVRLMRVAHPDGGGSDWLAARVNQARDVLLRSRSR